VGKIQGGRGVIVGDLNKSILTDIFAKKNAKKLHIFSFQHIQAFFKIFLKEAKIADGVRTPPPPNPISGRFH